MNSHPTDEECIEETIKLLYRTPRPIHSNFCVAAQVVYLDESGKYGSVFGVNSETCVMASCICAERCALTQLRLLPERARCVLSVYITATSEELITPGLLCREFMSEYTGEVCRRRETLEGAPLPFENLADDIRIVLFSHGARGGAGGEAGRQAVYTLRELYPHPPIYHGVGKGFLNSVASAFLARMEAVDESGGGGLSRCLGGRVPLKGASELYKSIVNLARTPHHSDATHPLHLAAGVLFSSGRCVLERQLPALEYGCTVDAVTRLSAAMGGRVGGEEGDADQPVLLFLVDQFGICHAPAAEPRSWLSEFGGVKTRTSLTIVLHEAASGALLGVTPEQLAPLAPNIFP